MIDLVCSVCGSANWYDPVPSVDKRWPLIRCRDHNDRGKRAPLISARAYQRRQRPASEKPADLFEALPDDEKAALAKPLRLL